jgi:hypothetical protein
MKHSIRALAVLAALAIGLPFLGYVGAEANVARPPSSHKTTAAGSQVASAGSLKAGAATKVVLSSLPSDGAAVQASGHKTLQRNGKPTGGDLPTGPSTGSKGTSANTAGPMIVANGFDGIGVANASCNCQPPDVNASIGPNHIVEAVNLSLAVYSKAGALLQNTALTTFLGTADGLSDPRVVYDPTWDRWTLVLTDTSSPSLWFAYSTSGDPTGGWWIYQVGFPLAAGSIVDYPMVGMDQDALIYTSNNYGPSTYTNSTAFTVPKARVYNGFGWSASLPLVNYNTTPSIVGGHPTQQTTRSYLLSPDDANDVMYVYYFSNTSQGSTLTYKGSIAYAWAAPPRRVNQPGTGTTLDPLDGRIGWAVSQLDNRLWFAHGANVSGFPSVNWGYVNPGAMTISASTAFVNGTSDDFNPSIAAMNRASGGTQQVLSWAYTDTPNGFATRTAYAIHTGISVAHVTGAAFSPVGGSTSNTRFGDYSSVAPEYNAVGTCSEGMYALVANQYFSPSGSWRTRLARVHPAC